MLEAGTNRKKRRLFALLLTAGMLFVFLLFYKSGAQAEDSNTATYSGTTLTLTGYNNEQFTASLDSNIFTLTSYLSPDITDVVIPGKVVVGGTECIVQVDQGTFMNQTSLKKITFQNVDDQVPGLTADATSLFSGCIALESIDFGSVYTAALTSTDSMFLNCASLKSLDLSGFSTANVAYMANMFNGCTSLQSVTLGSGFETVKATTLSGMFRGCSSLTTVDLSSFSADVLISMADMFYGCTSLKYLDLSSLALTDKFVFDNSTSSYRGLVSGCTSLKRFVTPKNFKTNPADYTEASTPTQAQVKAALALPFEMYDLTAGKSVTELPVTTDSAHTLSAVLKVTVHDGNDTTVLTGPYYYGSSLTTADLTSAGFSETLYTDEGRTAAFDGSETLTDDFDLYTKKAAEETKITITWKDSDGTVLRTDTVASGSTPSYGSEPSKENDEDGYKYTFNGWSNGINTYTTDQLASVTLTQDTVYTAVYQMEPADELTTRLYGYSLTLDGTIGVNFYMWLNDSVKKSKTAYVQFTVNGKETSKVYVKDVISDDSKNREKVGDRYYYKFTEHVLSDQMQDTITAQLFMDDKTGSVYTYSVNEYITAMLKRTDSKAQDAAELIKAMRIYGSFAQIYFDQDSAIADLDSTQMTYTNGVTAETVGSSYQRTVTGTMPEGLTYCGSSLLLQSQTCIRHYFEVADGHSFDEYTITCDGGKSLVKGSKNGLYYVEIQNIGSADLDVMYSVTCSDMTVKYGVYSYIYSKLNSIESGDTIKNLVRALYNYGEKANSYFAS